jgi:hypothetical protein
VGIRKARGFDNIDKVEDFSSVIPSGDKKDFVSGQEEAIMEWIVR